MDDLFDKLTSSYQVASDTRLEGVYIQNGFTKSSEILDINQTELP